MIKSMTGFGKSSLINEKREYQMEMKSVNHRYLDINIRLPRPLIFLEETIKKEIAAKIQRGKIEVFVTFNNKEQDSEKITINKELAKTYIKQLKELAEESQISTEINILEIVQMPDVLNISMEQDEEVLKKEIIELTQRTAEKLVEDIKEVSNQNVELEISEKTTNNEKDLNANTLEVAKENIIEIAVTIEVRREITKEQETAVGQKISDKRGD